MALNAKASRIKFGEKEEIYIISKCTTKGKTVMTKLSDVVDTTLIKWLKLNSIIGQTNLKS